MRALLFFELLKKVRAAGFNLGSDFVNMRAKV